MTLHVPRDVWIGLAMLAGAGLYWLGADGIPISPLDGAVNAAAMPKTLAYALGAFAILLIVRALSIETMARRAAAQAGEPEPALPATAPKIGTHLRAVGVLGIGVGYLLILYLTGYLIAAALLIMAMATYVGARFGPRLAAVAIALAVGFHVVFVELLGIPLPPGLLAPLLG
jgi:hypothetical protein